MFVVMRSLQKIIGGGLRSRAFENTEKEKFFLRSECKKMERAK